MEEVLKRSPSWILMGLWHEMGKYAKIIQNSWSFVVWHRKETLGQ